MYRDKPISGHHALHLLLDDSQDPLVSLGLILQYRVEESVHHEMGLLDLFRIRVVLGEYGKHHVDHLIIEVLAIDQLWDAVLQVELRAEHIQHGLALR